MNESINYLISNPFLLILFLTGVLWWSWFIVLWLDYFVFLFLILLNKRQAKKYVLNKILKICSKSEITLKRITFLKALYDKLEKAEKSE